MKSIAMIVCAIFCMVGGVFHSVAGIPALHTALAKFQVDAKLTTELSIFWVFMGASLVTFGGILLTAGLRMRKQDYSGSAMALWIAACLVLFNVGAMIVYGHFEPHFFTFAFVGVIIAAAALPAKKFATN